MKCVFMHEIMADEATLIGNPPLITKQLRDRRTGQLRDFKFFAPGTEYDTGTAVLHNAAWLCDRGVARPADDECRAACIPYSDEERERNEKAYAADAKGIHEAHDRDLFFRDIILGYEEVDDQLAYIPGPNWDQYEEQQLATVEADEGI